MRIAEFSESSNLRTHIALLGYPWEHACLSVCSPNSPWFTTRSELVRWCMSVCRGLWLDRQSLQVKSRQQVVTRSFLCLQRRRVCPVLNDRRARAKLVNKARSVVIFFDSRVKSEQSLLGVCCEVGVSGCRGRAG